MDIHRQTFYTDRQFVQTEKMHRQTDSDKRVDTFFSDRHFFKQIDNFQTDRQFFRLMDRQTDRQFVQTDTISDRRTLFSDRWTLFQTEK